MRFKPAIAIIISCPLLSPVTDRLTKALQPVLTLVLIGADRGVAGRKLLDKRTQRPACGILYHPQADLPCLAFDHAQHGQTFIGKDSAFPSLLAPIQNQTSAAISIR